MSGDGFAEHGGECAGEDLHVGDEAADVGDEEIVVDAVEDSGAGNAILFYEHGGGESLLVAEAAVGATPFDYL